MTLAAPAATVAWLARPSRQGRPGYAVNAEFAGRKGVCPACRRRLGLNHGSGTVKRHLRRRVGISGPSKVCEGSMQPPTAILGDKDGA